MAGSRSARIELDWADGRHAFRLAIGELEELQEKTDCGPLVLLKRLHEGTWRVADVGDTLRLGLIGAGMKPAAALDLVRRYVLDRPDWLHNARLAWAIVGAAISGVDDEPVKKKAAETVP